MEDYWSLGHQVQGGQYGVLKTNPGTVVHVCNLILILLSGQKQKDDELAWASDSYFSQERSGMGKEAV